MYRKMVNVFFKDVQMFLIFIKPTQIICLYSFGIKTFIQIMD